MISNTLSSDLGKPIKSLGFSQELGITRRPETNGHHTQGLDSWSTAPALSHGITCSLAGLQAAFGDSLELGGNILLEDTWERDEDGRILGLHRSSLWANEQRAEHQADPS